MKVLETHEREKKKKYLEPCLEQRRHFTPFVVSTDGLIGKEAKTLLKKLSARLAEKTRKQYSQVCGFVNARMSIAIVRATHLCLPTGFSHPFSSDQPTTPVGRRCGPEPLQTLRLFLLLPTLLDSLPEVSPGANSSTPKSQHSPPTSNQAPKWALHHTTQTHQHTICLSLKT
jgi:hypothetical protein